MGPEQLESRVGDAVSTGPLRVLLREDLRTGWGAWGRPGVQALLVYRLGHWARSGPADPRRLLARLVHRVLNTVLIRNVYGMEISPDAVIGRRVLIAHHQAVQIPAHCVIGDGTTLRHNVNIGFGGSDEDPTAVPHIGRDVQLGSGSCLIGAIRVGHGARIGPNCVVMSDVPDGATLVAPPPRVFKASAHSPVGRVIDLRDPKPEPVAAAPHESAR